QQRIRRVVDAKVLPLVVRRNRLNAPDTAWRLRGEAECADPTGRVAAAFWREGEERSGVGAGTGDLSAQAADAATIVGDGDANGDRGIARSHHHDALVEHQILDHRRRAVA